MEDQHNLDQETFEAAEGCTDDQSHGFQDVVTARVEHLRNRLLDSSRRNPLIQVPFRANSSSLIRFVDELPDDLAARLAGQSPMRLVALPPIDEPLPDEQTDEFLTALEIARTTDEAHLDASAKLDPTDPDYAQKEIDLERALKDRVRAELGLPERQTEENLSLADHARAHGISPDYILPLPDARHNDGRHDDEDIQTLLLPDRLARVGRSLHEKGHAFERETGVNVLHSAFGILEWNEPGSSRTPARSPLLLLEVRMERKKAPAGVEFHICGEGDVSLNTTLAQTFATQFGLELPVYEGGPIEDYLTEVADLAPPGWHWTIRREALLGVFPSSRIAMYRDLDPETRPVAENPIIGSLLASAGGDGMSYAGEYDTDAPEVEARVPRLVMDADASQFSSLVDVSKGENVAIEGPPGSGKSQTIVNLIASAMADGKKVLFVAEKLTALDVVRNRLEAAGLGEFVLPLQAGRGSRDAVFQSLEDRIAMEPPCGTIGDTHRARHETLKQRRSQMQAYLDMLGSKLGTTGLTVHEALGQAIATADDIAGLPREIRRLRLSHAGRIDPETQEAIRDDVQMVVDRLDGVDKVARLWAEAGKAPLRVDEAEDIANEFMALLRGIETFREMVAEEEASPFLPDNAIAADTALLLAALRALEGVSGADVDLAAALLDPETCAAAHALCEARDSLTSAQRDIAALLSDPDQDSIDAFLGEVRGFAGDLDGEINPSELEARVETVKGQLGALQRQLQRAEALPARWAERAGEDGQTLADLRLDAEMLLRAPEAVLARRTPDDARLVPTTAREAIATHQKLFADLEVIKKDLPRAGTHTPRDILAAADAIASAGLFRVFSGTYKAAWKLYRDDLGGDVKAPRDQAAAQMRDYASWAERRDSFTAEPRYTTALGSAFAGMTTDTALLSALASFHDKIGMIAQGDERLRYALEAGPLEPLRAFAEESEIPARKLGEMREDIATAERDLNAAEACLEAARRYCAAFHKAPCLDLDIVDRAIEARARIARGAADIASSPVAELLASHEDNDAIRAAATAAGAATDLDNADPALEALRTKRVPALIESAERLSERLQALRQEASDLAASIALPLPEDRSALVCLSERSEDIREAARRPEGLVEKARLLKSLKDVDARGLGALADWVQSPEGHEHRGQMPAIAAAILARSFTDEVETLHGTTLDAYDGADLDRLRKDIASIDKELITLSRDAIREDLVSRSNPPRGNGKGRVGTFTEMSLIHHQLGLMRNRVGVRDLTARAGSALLDLKPCWMMSPLAVAQYLHDGLKFDLVVIDEASQMTPENALGAIMRAKQVVVVGDTKQLPPTNFFQKVLDADDDDEDARTDSESILDMANTSFRPVRQLRWHYRSRHPHLIALSNKMVYDDKLVIFPAARDNDADLGVHLVEVENGTYKKGRNIEEAKAIVAGAIAHMRDHPDRSLGLATMNKDQTELILEEFEHQRARNPHVEAYIDRWAELDDGLEEFFVKNLETIQGDERDVIMISTLYGPDPETGKVFQRFGPVNSAHGHRRLNVLFSRAKEKIVTYSSMKPTDIQAEGKVKGVHMLRAWLEFSRTKQITDIQVGNGETESPFEDFVIAQIEAAGFEAVPQVGASGFRIDIGVRHPSWPYGFILAVECDGAPYHSSRSSRDRDRLRQQVLEGLGWRFHRIWSTDWFRDPRGQIEKLRAALDAALTRAKSDEDERRARRKAAAEAARLATEEAIARAERAAEEAVEEAAEAARAEKVQAPQSTQLSFLEDDAPLFRQAAKDEVDDGPDQDVEEPVPGKLSREAMAHVEARQEEADLGLFNRSATTRKRGFYWLGFLEGVAASNGIEDGEPEALLNEARQVDDFFGDSVEGSVEESLIAAIGAHAGDLMAAVDAHRSELQEALDDPDLDSEKDAINAFLGFCAGIICDGQITSEEARAIHRQLHASPILSEAPVFAQLRWAVDEALADAHLDEEEAEEIREWIAALVSDGYADTGIGSIGSVVEADEPLTDPAEIDFEGAVFVLTGKMSIGPRALIGDAIAARGGVVKPSVTDKTDYVVVSNTASTHWKTTHFGTKIEAARAKIRNGHSMRFVRESALAAALSET